MSRIEVENARLPDLESRRVGIMEGYTYISCDVETVLFT
jgi:hypothetical protein